MKRLIVFIILIGFIQLNLTCTKDKFVAEPCFSGDVLPIFITNCAMSGCHDNNSKEEGYDLTNYEGVMRGVKPNHPLLSEIYNVIKGSHPSMPPQKPLSTEQVQIIKKWINTGAKNNTNCIVACDTLNVTFSKNVNPILNKWCVGCHSVSNPQGGIDLSSYVSISNYIQNNQLLGSIKHQSGLSPMPKNGSKLSDCETRQIELWINAGYLNN